MASEIEKFYNGNFRMYQTIKFINRKLLQNLMVHGKPGRNVTETNARNVRDHFKACFNDPKESKLEPFIGNQRYLDKPITKDKVEQQNSWI